MTQFERWRQPETLSMVFCVNRTLHPKTVRHSYKYFSRYLATPEAWSKSWIHSDNPRLLPQIEHQAPQLFRQNQTINNNKFTRKME